MGRCLARLVAAGAPKYDTALVKYGEGLFEVAVDSAAYGKVSQLVAPLIRVQRLARLCETAM